MLCVIILVKKKAKIMHYTTALNASKNENDTDYRFKDFLCVCSNRDVAIRQNHFAGVALFLMGGDRVG